jgi:hypothetical protein
LKSNSAKPTWIASAISSDLTFLATPDRFRLAGVFQFSKVTGR